MNEICRDTMVEVVDQGALPNIIKTRDDIAPITVLADPNAEPADRFDLAHESKASWAKSGCRFGIDRLRERIEPWLTALCQSEHISLLIGSGITSAVQRLATGAAWAGMADVSFGEMSELIDGEAHATAKRSGRQKANFEDQLRVAIELARGLEIVGVVDKDAQESHRRLDATIRSIVVGFAEQVAAAERTILLAEPHRREEAFSYLVSFLMSFASRTGTRDRLHIFTTNYDRLIEAGADTAGVHLLDRFIGTLAPVFRASRLDLDVHYNPPGIRGEPRYLEGVARFTKLHGSIDWFEHERSVRRLPVPFGAKDIAPFIEAADGPDVGAQLLIYPNAAKDRETAAFPYVELFRDFAAAACRPNHTLFVFGHSLGDEHINRVMVDMLTIPSTHLVVMAYDDPLGRIMRLYKDIGRPAQISLLIGPEVGDFRTLVDNYLPKPAIDKTTFRMAELLRSRWTGSAGDRSHAEKNGLEGEQ